MPIKRKYEKTATDDYQDKMTVRMKHSEKTKIKAAAEKHGMTSNAYMLSRALKSSSRSTSLSKYKKEKLADAICVIKAVNDIEAYIQQGNVTSDGSDNELLSRLKTLETEVTKLCATCM